ncbi:hypothetical protein V1504DRAFT_4836 [Lipomyces starkeyi]
MTDTAFLDAIADSDVRDAVASYISTHSDATSVFASLISHFAPPSTSKKRKHSPQLHPSSGPATSPLIITPGISFSVPQRKKLTLAIYSDRIVLLPVTANTTDSEIIYSISTRDLTGYMYLPTPARATKSYTMVLLPRTPSPNKFDAMVFTVPDSAATFTGTQATDNEHASAIILRVLSNLGIPRLDDAQTFAVEAHRGTKDGYLNFSTHGVLFGFKKPIWYVAKEDIDAVSYESITRVTFNLMIAVAGDEEVEFGMIDQERFGEIDAYVRKWGLADRSMAEERMAKSELKHKHHENGGELSKAEQRWREQGGQVEDGAPGELSVDEDDDDEEDDENFEIDDDDDDGGSPSESSGEEDGGGGGQQDDDEPDYDEPESDE